MSKTDEEKKEKRDLVDPIMMAANVIQQEGRGLIRSDVDGSYTGTPEKGSEPEQDADDL